MPQRQSTPCRANHLLASSRSSRHPRGTLCSRRPALPSTLPDKDTGSTVITTLRVSLIITDASIASSIDQWIDYVNSTVAPLSQTLSNQIFGHDQTADMRTFSIALNQLKKTLIPVEKHLQLRNFLVGYSLTLADLSLVVTLLTPLQTILDKTFRKDTIPNLTRYCTLILQGKAFLEVFGHVHFSKKALQPAISKKEE